ncbi:hypothetical protein Tco_1539518 [Tanacetum coccineum]
MALPNKHQLKFKSYKDAKTLMQEIKNRFGGNAATKKTQKNLLKQQYENFAASNTEKELDMDNKRKIGFDKIKLHGSTATREGHFARSAGHPGNQDSRNKILQEELCQLKETTSNAFSVLLRSLLLRLMNLRIFRKENGAPIIRIWYSDSDEENVPKANHNKFEDKGVIDSGCSSTGQKQILSYNYRRKISKAFRGTKACNDAGKARMETVPSKDYILLPMWPADLLFSQDSKDSPDTGFKPLGEEEKKDDEDRGE